MLFRRAVARALGSYEDDELRLGAVDILAHVQRQIAAAEIIADPFPHLFIQDFFPPSHYRAMIRHFPDGFLHDTTGDTSSINLLSPGAERSLDADGLALWGPMRHIIYPPIMEMLALKLREQFAERINELESHGLFKPGSLKPAIVDEHLTNTSNGFMLLQRSEKFSIVPHIHGLLECLSVLHYFPADDSAREAGTQLYGVKSPFTLTVRPDEFPNIPMEHIDDGVTAPYLPNSALVWVNTFKAIHARASTPDMPVRRYIFTTIGIKPDTFNRDRLDPEKDGPLVVEFAPKSAQLSGP